MAMKTLDIWTDCDECGGSGAKGSTMDGAIEYPTPCPACNGTGRRYDPKVVEALAAALAAPAVLPEREALLDAIVAVADTAELEWETNYNAPAMRRLVGPWEEARHR